MIKIQPVNARWRFLVDRIESQIASDYVNRYDQDSNGSVDKSEFQGKTDAFDRIDRNQDSRLEESEVKRYIDLLRQHEPARGLERGEQPSQNNKGPSFSVSSYDKITGSIRDFYSDEIENLDKNGNGFLEEEELGVTREEFSRMDLDQNNLISSREWAEGFLENDAEIQMVLDAYRFSEGTFQNTGGMIQLSV